MFVYAHRRRTKKMPEYTIKEHKQITQYAETRTDANLGPKKYTQCQNEEEKRVIRRETGKPLPMITNGK